jgi:hypothetical protein
MKFILLLIFSQLAQAQTYNDDLSPPDLKMLKQEGQLVSIQIVIGEPLRIFVVGREEAKFDFSELKLTVKRINPYPGKMLSLTKNGDYYAISESLNFKYPTDLEIKTVVKNKEETFHFKIETQLH